MDVITTHLHADCDGLAAMVAARKLYPGAVLVFPRGTQEPERLGPLQPLCTNPAVAIHLFDHHLAAVGDASQRTCHADLKVVEPVGATTTVVIERMLQRRSPWRGGNCMTAMISHDILVPTDFGPGSRLALERAMRSLGPEGGTLCVLHVLDQHLIAQMQALVPDLGETELRARLRQQAETHYTHLVAGLARDKVTVEPMIIEGTPFLKIVQLAHDLDVDMIVMTVHRSVPHIEQFLFGSTAERVLRLAPCAVLIVPETMATPPLAPAAEVGSHAG